MGLGNNNFFSWFGSGTKGRELSDTRASWNDAETAWHASPLAHTDAERLADEIVTEVMRSVPRVPNAAVIAALCEATEALLRAETIGELEVLWPKIEGNVEVAIEFRAMLPRRKRWAKEYERMKSVFAERLARAYRAYVSALPEACFAEEGKSALTVPLIELIENPRDVVQSLVAFPFDDDVFALGLFHELRAWLRKNLTIASGLSPEAVKEGDLFVFPSMQKDMDGRTLADAYLGETPLAALFEVPVPFSIPEASRFEHCHVIGGTGHGKTQFLQKLIHADLVQSQYDRRSVVVLDSQGDLIAKLSRLELFSPYVGNGLGERFLLIDPSDVEYPFSLNLFDAHTERLREYSPADRERVLNGIVELYETFFDALLGAELTQRQDVLFRYIARLMLAIPNATIHTLLDLMENGKAFAPYMETLDGSARRFFEKEFFHPSFGATKGQIAKRLWGVLSTPAFERIFSQRENKLDLFHALNDGKIILVNTAKDVLKEEGSRLFGRFFIAMLAQAALERSTIPEAKRTPTFVYVDEAHEYFDDRIETILNQARKYRVSLTLAHQNLDQLSPRLRSALLTNASTKCAGGVSAKDARTLAEELHTTPEFIDGMKRAGAQTEFALWVKHQTPHAIRVSVPLGFLERQYTLDEEAFDELIAKNRERYCGTLAGSPPSPRIEAAIPQREAAPIVAPVSRPSREMPSRAVHETFRDAPAIPGKGGPKHKYLQSLVKELAIANGLKATVEAPLPDGSGQVDVLLERDGVVAAVEISVTTPLEYEQGNVRKCLDAGYPRVAVILSKSKTTQARYEAALRNAVPQETRERVSFLTPEMVPAYVASLAPKEEPKERVVRGYKVRVRHEASTPDEARARHEAVAKVIARSLSTRKQSGD